MRRLLRSSGVALGLPLMLALATSCADNSATRPTFQGKPIPVNAPRGNFVIPSDVRISEVHYDNTLVDTLERIEITASVGTDLSKWTLVLYNGSGGASYNTKVLAGIVSASPGCSAGRGVVTFSYPKDGIQNGSPDGMALVGPAGLVEFLTYEGIFVAVGGPAGGKTGTDIGVVEPGNTAPTLSLQRSEADPTFWAGPVASTFNSCNQIIPPPPVAAIEVSPASEAVYVGATQTFTARAFDATHTEIPGIALTWTSSNTARATVNGGGVATGVSAGSATITAAAANGVSGTATLTIEPLPALTDVRFSELHYDNLGTDTDESIEIEGPAGTDLSEWTVVLYNGSGGTRYDTREVAAVIPDMCNGRGVIRLAYDQDGIQNGSPDGLALVDANGQLVEFLSYEGTVRAVDGPAAGRRSVEIGVSQNNTALGLTLQRNTLGAWVGPIPSSLGGCFGSAPVPPSKSIAFSGRTGGDAPLPVGFEDQLFATLRSPTGVTIPSTFTWEAVTPEIATIDQDGVMHAVSPGRATFRAIAEDGTTGTFSLNMAIATPGTAALYGNNTEFGEPTDADARDDFLVRRREFTTSFNKNRGIPNWVAYNLEATHIVSGQDRCDCFTYDPLLPPDFRRYTTADYTGAGAFHGYGIDRGHLTRSFDRTTGSLDNANTYYFSNIIPQAADNNQGPWASFENHLGSLAQNQNREIYIVAGGAGSKGTVKNEGLITIPTHTWKVAVIMPRDQGLANVDSYDDVEIISIIMPNDAGIRNVPWETYKTTVNAVETLSGYDVLALLDDNVEGLVESGLAEVAALVHALESAGSINGGAANSLTAKLSAAAASIERGNRTAAANQLRAFSNEVDAMERSGRLSSTDATALRAAAQRIADAL